GRSSRLYRRPCNGANHESPSVCGVAVLSFPQAGRCRKSSARASAGRTRPRTQLHLEPLEDRTVPAAVAPPSGLVSWWTADNTAADLEGLNNATLYNGTTFAA